MGTFNTKNTTSIESRPESKQLSESIEMTPTNRDQRLKLQDLENSEMNDETNLSGKPIDYKLYKNFWGIQKYLNNPMQVRD